MVVLSKIGGPALTVPIIGDVEDMKKLESSIATALKKQKFEVNQGHVGFVVIVGVIEIVWKKGSCDHKLIGLIVAEIITNDAFPRAAVGEDNFDFLVKVPVRVVAHLVHCSNAD